MSRILVHGFAALAMAAFVMTPNQTLAIQHGCTPPTGIDDLTIDMDLGGQKSRASGGYCAAIQQAVAFVDGSRLPASEKDAAKKALAKLSASGSGQTAAGWQVGGGLTCTLGKGGGCTLTVQGGGSGGN